ncbi:hypothetical protein ACX3YG_14445 [Pseudomonas wadenswilerensis]
MAEEKTGAAKHSKDYRGRKKAEAERLGIEEVKTLMPAGIKAQLAEAMVAHGYTQVQELWQDMQLSWIAADHEERARRLKRPDAPAFKISAKLARHYERVAMAE